MKQLRIAPELALPLEAVTQTFGVLAVRGAGKSNLAAVMAEEMAAAKLPFVVVDPVGSWWGVRSSGDGKGPGLSVPIFGGAHGDVLLERTAGQVIADLVVGERLSCVVDVSDFSEGDKIRFLIDFAERLYRKNQDPLHLFLEEADDYAPQRPFREQARLLRAWENIVRRGRARGLGITMISQRSASLNKSVLTQIETLFVLRTTSPQDRKAIRAWVEYHGQAKELLESLPGLEAGEAWVWSPSWLRTMKRVQVRRRWTFDSAATPKDVRGARPPATLADVDLGAVKAQMAATIERAKAEDPRELRKQIADLKRQLEAMRFQAERQKGAKEALQAQPREVPVLKDAQVKRLETIVDRIVRAVVGVQSAAHDMDARADEIKAGLAATKATRPAGSIGQAGTTSRVAAAVGVGRPAMQSRLAPVVRPRANAPASEGAIGAGERRILVAIAQHQDGVTREQLTVLTGYKRSSRDTYLQRLRAAGLVDQRGELIVVTDTGVAELGHDFEPLPTGPALRDYWMAKLPEGERRILDAVVRAYPNTLPREGLEEATGYRRSSRDTYLQRLRSRKLVEDVGRGQVRASRQLFEVGA